MSNQRAGIMRAGFYVFLAVQVAWLIVVSGGTQAQAPANPQRGREIATRLCAGCHVVESATSGSVRADVPSFQAIAKRTGVTAEYLAGRIIIPHPAMPGVPLTADEIRDVVAYILTLK